ncbi:hypothetical protein SAY87_021850 [Trapa incisa]|uniref:serine O-acetyltransferase n=1 Tax=Trapa incisa TaxID=236973 RepID=A0AAN7JTW4_9MYRT|nr:hypothetical protein SAY87_021850 [Trapa incisa]
MAACIDTSRSEGRQALPETKAPHISSCDYEHDCDYQSKITRFCRPTPCNHASMAIPTSSRVPLKPIGRRLPEIPERDDVWVKIREEAKLTSSQEPILSSYYQSAILSHDSFASALANHLALKLGSPMSFSSAALYDLFKGALMEDKGIVESAEEDLRAVMERDPACIGYLQCFLNFKGFLACQAHRVAHRLWSQGRLTLAQVLQSRVSEVFAMDIHPGARIGRGVLFDHATGVVIGETAVVGDHVSILHKVTLGGNGKATGDRHPKIGDGVLIGAGTSVLGNIRVGEGAKIGAGSVVLKEVPPRTTAAGNPARLVGGEENPVTLDRIPSLSMDHTWHTSDWSDYVI